MIYPIRLLVYRYLPTIGRASPASPKEPLNPPKATDTTMQDASRGHPQPAPPQPEPRSGGATYMEEEPLLYRRFPLDSSLLYLCSGGM